MRITKNSWHGTLTRDAKDTFYNPPAPSKLTTDDHIFSVPSSSGSCDRVVFLSLRRVVIVNVIYDTIDKFVAFSAVWVTLVMRSDKLSPVQM